MDRIYKHRGAVRRMVPHLKATAVAVTLLGVCGLGTADIAYGQVGVESAIVNSGAATPAKPLKMSGSGPIQVTIGSPATAEASRDTSIKGPNCVGAMRAHSEVTVPVGKSTMVQLPEPVRNRTVGNPNVVQAMLVSPQTLYLLGQEVGTTNMIVQGRSDSCSVIDVAVGADPGATRSRHRRWWTLPTLSLRGRRPAPRNMIRAVAKVPAAPRKAHPLRRARHCAARASST